MQEDDVIGILTSDNIADLKPLGDRILLEARTLDHVCRRCLPVYACITPQHARMICKHCRDTGPALQLLTTA